MFITKVTEFNVKIAFVSASTHSSEDFGRLQAYVGMYENSDYHLQRFLKM